MENLDFWAIVLGLVVAIGAFLLRALTQSRETAAPEGAVDLQVYRDQMSEVDRDLARGTLAEVEAQRLRTEIGRRLLEADRTAKAEPTAPAAVSILVPAAVVVAALAAAVALYLRIGLPGYPDLPIAERLADADAALQSRPSQAEAAANTPAPQPPADIPEDFLALMEKLRAAVDPATSIDLRGLELLARNEAALGNLGVAETAQRRLISVKAAGATGEDFAGLAEILIRAAGGYVSPEAEAELIHALERDPANGAARYYSGLMFAQNGRYDRAFALWRPLFDTSPPDAPWMPALTGQIEEIASLAGVNYALPDSKGPSAGDMAAAADMTPEERQAMIEGMVGQLQDRLTSEGGSAEEWVKLINALGVLGRTEDAQAAYADAKTRFAGQTAELELISGAATAAGLAP